jgi:hypothetical protein
VREHDDHHHHCQDHCIDDWPRYGQALRRQRRREKDQAELKNQQDRQTRVSELILPGADPRSLVIDNDGMAFRPMHGHGPFTRLQNTSGMTLKG